MEVDKSKILTLSNKIYTINDKIGEGAYGNVYECKTETNDIMAVKCIPIKRNGLPCLIEASIMSSVKHKHINYSEQIDVKDECLYITQKKALCDLYALSRRERNKTININQLKRWSYEILQGLECLHKQQIVHGDVKSSNILIFDDGNVKLADFTLSIKIDGNRFPSHPICTITHRPLEALLQKEWSFPIDIWAYGCTLYELAYGEFLFPYQGDEPTDKSWKASNCILDWRKEVTSPLYKNDIDFKRVKYAKYYSNPEMVEVNKFIHYILRINPSDRPTIKSLLSHDFFSSLTPFPYIYVYPKILSMDEDERSSVNEWIDKNIQSTSLQKLIFTLYNRCQTLDMIMIDKLESCTSIASKLFHVSCCKYKNILEKEIRICKHLNYRLHW